MLHVLFVPQILTNAPKQY